MTLRAAPGAGNIGRWSYVSLPRAHRSWEPAGHSGTTLGRCGEISGASSHLLMRRLPITDDFPSSSKSKIVWCFLAKSNSMFDRSQSKS